MWKYMCLCVGAAIQRANRPDEKKAPGQALLSNLVGSQFALLAVGNLFQVFLAVFGGFDGLFGVFVSTDHGGPEEDGSGNVGASDAALFSCLGFKFLGFGICTLQLLAAQVFVIGLAFLHYGWASASGQQSEGDHAECEFCFCHKFLQEQENGRLGRCTSDHGESYQGTKDRLRDYVREPKFAFDINCYQNNKTPHLMAVHLINILNTKVLIIGKKVMSENLNGQTCSDAAWVLLPNLHGNLPPD
jgi:hypothetical protein